MCFKLIIKGDIFNFFRQNIGMYSVNILVIYIYKYDI